jgi:hypothetical protein
MVDFHYRLAAPWLCIIVILLGVPFGMHTGRRGMGMGILLALLTFFGYYILMGLCLAYGKRGLIPPAVAGWLPGAVFSCSERCCCGEPAEGPHYSASNSCTSSHVRLWTSAAVSSSSRVAL